MAYLSEMIRCNNCGYENPPHLTRCKKCNQPLFQIENLIEEQTATCCDCGYPLALGTDVCPNCGKVIGSVQSTEEITEKIDTRQTTAIDSSQLIKEECSQLRDMSTIDKPIYSGKTVVDNGPKKGEEQFRERFRRHTVADFSSKTTRVENSKSFDEHTDQDGTRREFVLECIDDDFVNTIRLISNFQLTLIRGDILLIAGQRYKVGLDSR